jgi:hypothetical protein
LKFRNLQLVVRKINEIVLTCLISALVRYIKNRYNEESIDCPGL